jgi:hypothetical protein
LLAALLKVRVVPRFLGDEQWALSLAGSDTMTVRVEVVVLTVEGKRTIAWHA